MPRYSTAGSIRNFLADPRLDASDWFAPRHIGPSADERQTMLDAIGLRSLDALIDEVVPPSIRLPQPLGLPAPESEHQYCAVSRASPAATRYSAPTLASAITTRLRRASSCAWCSRIRDRAPYTPYQAEIAQGRLESLLNFQTMVADLTGMEVANASLLDEATAAAEAMTLLHRVRTTRVQHGTAPAARNGDSRSVSW